MSATSSTSTALARDARALPALAPPFGECPSRMHSTPAAASCIGVAPASLELDRVRRRMRVVFYKVGRSVLYRESDLMAFLDRCRVEA